MARVTVEDCLVNVPNRFDLVIMAAKRARQLTSGAEPTLSTDNDKFTVVALREIAENSIDLEALIMADDTPPPVVVENDPVDQETARLMAEEAQLVGVEEEEAVPANDSEDPQVDAAVADVPEPDVKAAAAKEIAAGVEVAAVEEIAADVEAAAAEEIAADAEAAADEAIAADVEVPVDEVSELDVEAATDDMSKPDFQE